jgi:hypothetical protein
MTITLPRFDVTQRNPSSYREPNFAAGIAHLASECAVNSALLLVRLRYLAWDVRLPESAPRRMRLENTAAAIMQRDRTIRQ